MTAKISVLALVVALVGLFSASASAEECEREIPGNLQSPCVDTRDLAAGANSPTLRVEVGSEERTGERYCIPVFRLYVPGLSPDDDVSMYVSLLNPVGSYNYGDGFRQNDLPQHDWVNAEGYFDIFFFYDTNRSPSPSFKFDLESSVPETFSPFWHAVALRLQVQVGRGSSSRYDFSETLPLPSELGSFQLLVNECLAELKRQEEHEAAMEVARIEAEERRVAEAQQEAEAANEAAIDAERLASAEAQLASQERLNASKLTQTLLRIKREDAVRALWQETNLIRMAGLEARTTLWTEAVARWEAEDLRFSEAMQSRIAEVERLQLLNAALEQALAEQRVILAAQISELEKREAETIADRTEAAGEVVEPQVEVEE